MVQKSIPKCVLKKYVRLCQNATLMTKFLGSPKASVPTNVRNRLSQPRNTKHGCAQLLMRLAVTHLLRMLRALPAYICLFISTYSSATPQHITNLDLIIKSLETNHNSVGCGYQQHNTKLISIPAYIPNYPQSPEICHNRHKPTSRYYTP